jgi:hypothetical protein
MSEQIHSLEFQSNISDPDFTKIRELVLYCEARFRAALKVVFSVHSPKKEEQYRKYLAMELVYLTFFSMVSVGDN